MNTYNYAIVGDDASSPIEMHDSLEAKDLVDAYIQVNAVIDSLNGLSKCIFAIESITRE